MSDRFHVRGLPAIFAMVSILSFVSGSDAQQTLTLNECLKLAHSQAPALIEAKESFEAAKWNVEAANLSRRSKLDLNLFAPIYTDNTSPIYNPLTGTTDLLKTQASQFGGSLELTQPIFWTGGSVVLDGGLFKRAQRGLSGTSVNDYLGSGAVSIVQPIFVANEYKLASRESDIDLDLAFASYATQWAQLNYQIESLFFNLYQSEQQLKIQKDEVDASQTNYDLASNKYKAGLIAEVDALQLEVDLAAAQTDLFDKERLHLVAERNLAAALGLALDRTIMAQLDSLSDIGITVNPANAIAQGLQNREDVLSARYDIDRQGIALDRLSGRRSVNARLTGSFGATQNSPDFALLSQNPYVNRGVTLSVNVPLFDWGSHSLQMDAQQSQIELTKTTLSVKEQQIEQEVRSVLEQLEASKKEVDIAKRSVAVAEKAYDLSRARFDAGKITSQDLTLAQQRLTKARFATLNAQVAEHLALADLTQKTLFDFETGRKVEPN